MLQGPAIDVDEDPPPEVVLEVDHTTDVRQLVDLAISQAIERGGAVRRHQPPWPALRPS